jgi:hypothetical protein
VLYAKAEVQNVRRRRMEKDIQDARLCRDRLCPRHPVAWPTTSRARSRRSRSLREDDSMKGFVAGIEATQRELDKVFASTASPASPPVGLPLDPNQHQAMLEVPTDEAEPGTVVQEMQAGWMIKDRLLRPAMVAGGEEAGRRSGWCHRTGQRDLDRAARLSQSAEGSIAITCSPPGAKVTGRAIGKGNRSGIGHLHHPVLFGHNRGSSPCPPLRYRHRRGLRLPFRCRKDRNRPPPDCR